MKSKVCASQWRLTLKTYCITLDFEGHRDVLSQGDSPDEAIAASRADLREHLERKSQAFDKLDDEKKEEVIDLYYKVIRIKEVQLP